MKNNSFAPKWLIVSKRAVASAVLLLLVAIILPGALLSGCGQSSKSKKEVTQAESPLLLTVTEVHQQKRIGDRNADGQYVIAKLQISNNSNETIVLKPEELILQNKTSKEEERYTQPAERGLTFVFNKAFGAEYKGKLLDFSPVNLYPRLNMERFLIFMLPLKADAYDYEIVHKPTETVIPLATSGKTLIHDNRNAH